MHSSPLCKLWLRETVGLNDTDCKIFYALFIFKLWYKNFCPCIIYFTNCKALHSPHAQMQGCLSFHFFLSFFLCGGERRRAANVKLKP